MAKSLHHQIIARALELISDEAHWTCLVVARAANGRPCSCLDPAAARFCALGALYSAAHDLIGDADCGMKAVMHVLAANDRSSGSLPRINDQEGHAVIVAMFKRALAA